MTKIVFVSGPALGHLARVSQVVAQLRLIAKAEMTIVYPDLKPLPPGLFDPEIELWPVAIDPADQALPAPEFGEALEAILSKIDADIIVFDCDPVRWLSTMRFPPIPRVCITNVFLCNAGAPETQQDMNFRSFAAAINSQRERKGLSELRSARECYRANEVLLADPDWVVSTYSGLPANHIACGPAWWSPQGKCPRELAGLDSLLLCSMGSTGKPLSDRFCMVAAEKTGCKNIVRVHAGKSGISGHRYGRKQIWDCGVIPLDGLLSRSRIVVTQGGAGSTYQALAAGKPVLTVPNHKNHAILGDRLEDIGVSRRVSSTWEMLAMPAKAIDDMGRAIAALGSGINDQGGARRMAERIAGIA